MNLLKSLVAISSMTLFSRLLGFIRDTIIARLFGADMASDAFFIAFKIPNMLRHIFAEGAFSQAFIPILTEYKSKYSKTATQIFLTYIFGLLTLVLALVTITGMLTAPWIILLTAPGFLTHSTEKYSLTTALLRVTFPYIFLISLTSLVGAVLNTWHYFSVPAFSPTLLNISIIIFALLAAQWFHPPVMALAWAILVGGILQFIYQLPYLKRIDMLALPRLQLRDPGIWLVLQHMGQAILGVSVRQISLIINTIFASFLEAGSISWMYYADRLIELPSGILGVALGTILLPSLSQSFIRRNPEEYSCLLDWGLRLCFTLALPSSVALGIIAHPLTIALFQYGKFSAFDTLMTKRALIAYAVGLTGLILVKVLTTSFYSRHNIKIPVCVSIFTIVMTQLMNLTFIGPMKHVGLSLSISLAACLNAALLYWQLRRKKLFQPQPGWCNFFMRLLLAVVVMAASLVGVLSFMPDWAHGGIFLRLMCLVAVVTVGIIVYFFMLWILGFRLYHFMLTVKTY